MSLESSEFSLKTPYIELYKLLKVEGIASTGGEAKAMIASGAVKVNDQVEQRKRNKLLPGDIVAVEDSIITIVKK